MVLSALAAIVPARPSVDKDLGAFVRPAWGDVLGAKTRLEAVEAAAIPALIDLAFREDRVPLEDTGDLIYPGARFFYGHGELVDYELDILAARAGWLLEDLTFQDFGFSFPALNEKVLLQAIAGGRRDMPLSQAVPSNAGQRGYRAEAADRRGCHPPISRSGLRQYPPRRPRTQPALYCRL